MLYTELRAEMKRAGVRSHDFALWLDLSDQSVSHRMAGHTPWALDEMYTIMNKLHIPAHKMHIVFPRDGKWAGSLADPDPTVEQKLIAAIRQMIKEVSA